MGQSGQATVELAVILPVVLMMLLAVVQAGLIVRDRLLLVNAARVAGRAVIVSPTVASASEALRGAGSPTESVKVQISGNTSPGGLAKVAVRKPATQVPVVGRFVRGVVLVEDLTVRIEGPS